MSYSFFLPVFAQFSSVTKILFKVDTVVLKIIVICELAVEELATRTGCSGCSAYVAVRGAGS